MEQSVVLSSPKFSSFEVYMTLVWNWAKVNTNFILFAGGGTHYCSIYTHHKDLTPQETRTVKSRTIELNAANPD
jgi:hypothetical protein